MPLLIPLAWGAAALATGWAVTQAGDAVGATTKPVKWLVAGGVVYVAYKALQAAGAIK